MDQPGKRRARSLFLEAQHQLRQPLNALSLMVGELQQAPGGRDLKIIADDMRYALQLSNAWLDCLADLEAAEQGLLALDIQAVPLQPIFAKLRDDFARRFTQLGLDFRVVSSQAVVRADPALLRRLLALLLDNAAKFTSSGKVLLGCRRTGADLRIEVWDSGLGIGTEKAEQIFEPFFRLENEVRPRERGLGLGLTFARRLAALAGDRLTLRSERGRGSCFALTLQTASAAGARCYGDGDDGRDAASLPAEPVNPLEGAEVLLLEGVEAALLAASLQSWGAVVRITPAEGLATALAARPALAISDRAAFAAAGGWEIAAHSPTAILLVTDAPPDKADPRAGLAHYLQRPVKPARLRSLCHFALSRPAP
ncbi:MAG: ATP-binding protein [Kiloniellaceae bacterium]